MTPLQVILAEDNPHDVTLVRMALNDLGADFALSVIPDGEQAIALIDRLEQDPHPPTIDLLLLDLHLPKIDGEEVLKRLRSSTRGVQIPVVVMTGSSAPRRDQPAPAAGPVRYFRKPSSFAEYMLLGGIVRDLLFPSATRRSGDAA